MYKSAIGNVYSKDLTPEEERILNIYSRIPPDKKELYIEIGKLMK